MPWHKYIINGIISIITLLIILKPIKFKKSKNSRNRVNRRDQEDLTIDSLVTKNKGSYPSVNKISKLNHRGQFMYMLTQHQGVKIRKNKELK